jgi:DNA-binding transcriptional ArsR family regulator
MGVWLVTADVLAASRFVTSPLTETVNALGVLAARNPQPWERDWLARHEPAFLDRIKTDPFSTALAQGMRSGRWLPVDLSLPPRPGDVTFEQELARVRTVPPRVAKFDLSQSAGGRLPGALDVSDPAGSFADLLQWIWDHAVRVEWPRRKRKYEADIVSRTTVLSQRGWAAAVGGIAKDVRWLGGGQLQITVQDHPPLDLSRAELMFIPSSLPGGRVAWEYPARFAVIYPAAGMLASSANPGAPEPLRRLLGPTRAEILLLIGNPITTTQLVAVTGLALGTIGDHLRVLLDAGLAERQRSGAHVLYHRTPIGQQLIGHGPRLPLLLLEHPHQAVHAEALLGHRATGRRLVDRLRQGLGDVVGDLVLRHAGLLRHLGQLLRVDRVLDVGAGHRLVLAVANPGHHLLVQAAGLQLAQDALHAVTFEELGDGGKATLLPILAAELVENIGQSHSFPPLVDSRSVVTVSSRNQHNPSPVTLS